MKTSNPKKIKTHFDSVRNKIINGFYVTKYNIALALLEKYFIPIGKYPEFEVARFKQDMSAHKTFGILINKGVNPVL